jgi:hypothetical protein
MWVNIPKKGRLFRSLLPLRYAVPAHVGTPCIRPQLVALDTLNSEKLQCADLR